MHAHVDQHIKLKRVKEWEKMDEITASNLLLFFWYLEKVERAASSNPTTFVLRDGDDYSVLFQGPVCGAFFVDTP